eukprot:gene168-biopygen151
MHQRADEPRPAMTENHRAAQNPMGAAAAANWLALKRRNCTRFCSDPASSRAANFPTTRPSRVRVVWKRYV